MNGYANLLISMEFPTLQTHTRARPQLDRAAFGLKVKGPRWHRALTVHEQEDRDWFFLRSRVTGSSSPVVAVIRAPPDHVSIDR